jgi:hypothetical protein
MSTVKKTPPKKQTLSPLVWGGALFSVLVIASLFVWKFAFKPKQEGRVSSKVSPLLTEPARLPAVVLKPTPQAKVAAQRLLKKSLGRGELETKSLAYLNELMKDPNIATFFNYSLDFFKYRAEAYPVARMLALTLVFNDTPEHRFLMSWTKKEIAKYSNEIVTTLNSKKDQIFISPYFHNRMLNLVNMVNVPALKKIEFFANTLAQPLYFNEEGELSEHSQVIEVALILAKQNTKNASEAAPMVARAIASNSEPQQIQALKTRVLNYYPELSYLFVE